MNHIHRQSNAKKAFSLIELVIVIVIIGIIAAIAIPKMSRGSAGAGDTALHSNLAVLRNAVELYATEHNGKVPSGTAAQVAEQLTKYTDINGTVGAKDATTYIYGPYLRKMPALPVGTKRGKNGIEVTTGTALTPTETDPNAAWLYSSATGEIIANLDPAVTGDKNKDAALKPYSEY